MASAKRNTEEGAGNVTIYVTATMARVFRLAGTMKAYQKWPEPGKLGRYYTIPEVEARRVIEAAELARDKIDKSDAGKRKGLSCFLSNARSALDKQKSETAFARFLESATTASLALDTPHTEGRADD